MTISPAPAARIAVFALGGTISMAPGAVLTSTNGSIEITLRIDHRLALASGRSDVTRTPAPSC